MLCTLLRACNLTVAGISATVFVGRCPSPHPICRISTDFADSDEVQLHLFRAGAPQVEVWAEDPALWELPLTRELFAIASRIIDVRRHWRARAYPRSRRTDDPAEHRRFLATSCEGGYRGTLQAR